jgi:hypothetical protein
MTTFTALRSRHVVRHRREDYGWGYAVHLLLRATGATFRLLVAVARDLILAAAVAATTTLAGAAVLGLTVWGR